MKLFSTLGCLGLVQAVERCPIFAEKGWRLVRRTVDDTHTEAADSMAGSQVKYGKQILQMKGAESFSEQFDKYVYEDIIFMTGDCEKWVRMKASDFEAGNFDATVKVTSSANKEEHDHTLNWSAEGPIISVGANDGTCNMCDDTCGVIYAEGEANAALAACEAGADSISKTHQGLNVYIWTTGEIEEGEGEGSADGDADGGDAEGEGDGSAAGGAAGGAAGCLGSGADGLLNA